MTNNLALKNNQPNNKAGHRKRLYQRLIENGPDSLLDYEIVEIMLFLVFKRQDTKTIAKALINRFGSIDKIISATKKDLLEIDGIGESCFFSIKIIEAVIKSTLRSKIIQRNTIECFDDVVLYCKNNMKFLVAEELHIIFLNTINEIISDHVINKGTIDHVNVAPREVVRKCIETGAKGFILIHNHPSGDPTPSLNDISLTKRIKEAADVFNIDLYDHVIIGGNRHISFRNLAIIK